MPLIYMGGGDLMVTMVQMRAEEQSAMGRSNTKSAGVENDKTN